MPSIHCASCHATMQSVRSIMLHLQGSGFRAFSPPPPSLSHTHTLSPPSPIVSLSQRTLSLRPLGQVNVGAISLLREVSIKTITIYFWHPRSSGPLGWGVVGGLVGGLAWGASLLARRLLQH
jgi:hypothetical protein